ncbi:F0F1 ATP synthase subunit B [Kamptonema cortianum]|nr:F0F1 ATP synthase subunit B [Geitlerinema splendidum]MDK3155240.1 F0F1 ATP synthase subunit B [Kamptonema cortianum]
MSEIKQTRSLSGPASIAAFFIGLVLMVTGWQLYVNHTFDSLEKPLMDMGIPISFGKVIAVIGVFLILFKVLEIFYFNPLNEAIDNRTNELESTFSEAESLRTEMASMKSDYEKRLVETESRAREQIQAQIKEAQELKKSLMADAQRQAEEYKQQAISEIEAEKRKVMTELRVEVTKLSLQATEKILGENVDSDRNRKLIDEFLSTVEVRN